MNSRWYDGATGRFISADSIVPDPTNPQSFNRYSYVINNPVNYVDPSGHIACNDSNLPGEDHFCPEIGASSSWINTSNVTMYQDWGNTEISFSLGTTNLEPVDKDGQPTTKHPNYSYCNGFHCGIDQFATAGTQVRAGIEGRVIYIADWNAYEPRYIVIRVGNVNMRIAHLDASKSAPVAVGDWVTPDTVVGQVADYFGNNGNHVHIEFFEGDVGREGNYLNPHQFMTSEFNKIVRDNRVNVNGMNFHVRSDELYDSLETQPMTIPPRRTNYNINEPGYTIPHGWKGHEHVEPDG